MARSPTTTSSILTLVTLFSASRFASALQVTPNSPCASQCLDSLDLDFSDPNSSNTRNSDIVCPDTAYSSPAGTKFKECMTCLQTSTFSQGSESDTKWFLYNLRYAAAYCVFGYPNATSVEGSVCTIDKACGPLQASLEHGVPDPKGTTTYSYCSVDGGAAGDYNNYDSCLPCIGAERKTDYLANYFVALQAGCLQQPSTGVILGLNDTIFSETRIAIIDPTAPKEETSDTALATPAIVGIAAGALVLILIVAGATFVCYRKRKNRRARARAEAEFYASFGPQRNSSTSFQCQTHMVSPRFWPSAGEASTPTDEGGHGQAHPSSWNPQDAYQSPYQDDATAHISKKAAMAAVPLHHITTSVPPVPPPQAYTSPSSIGGATPLSAESARSSTTLLPSIRPYVPSEHGFHGSPPSAPASTFTSPTSGVGTTPLLKSHGWAEHSHKPQQQQQQQQQKPQKNLKKSDNSVPPPPPPQLKTSRSSGILGKKNAKNAATGSPVESWEIQTAFAAPPKK